MRNRTIPSRGVLLLALGTLLLGTVLLDASAAAQSLGGAVRVSGGAGIRPGSGPVRVWVVDDDGGPGVDFMEVQPAVTAAGEGDVVLVREGYYDSFSLAGKGLAIVGTGSFRPALNYTTVITGLAAHQRLLLRGLQLGPTSIALDLRNSTGELRLEDCMIEGDDTFGSSGSKDALRIQGCANVVIERCGIRSPNEPYGENGCVAVQSNLVVRDSWMQGGLPDLPSTTGGTGLSLTSSTLFAEDSLFVGGTGGFGGYWGPPDCFPGGTGGTGLSLVASHAILSGCTTAGGQGGTAPESPCANGAPGLPIDADASSSVTLLLGWSRR